MWNFAALNRLDLRLIATVLLLMIASLLTIASSATKPGAQSGKEALMNPLVLSQIKFFILGSIVFVLAASFDYNKLREWTWILYFLMIVSLLGLFFTPAIQGVHRWYRIPFVGMSFQPSEFAKLVVVIALSWFLEKSKGVRSSLATVWYASFIVGLPFLLILKQPDLGSALVLIPITLVMFYIGDIQPTILKVLFSLTAFFLGCALLIFYDVIPFEEAKPYAHRFLKQYQYERLNPNTHHQNAARYAIALGGLFGRGWNKGEYTQSGWLPAANTDSVFPALGEEFGFFGLLIVLALYYLLIYFCTQAQAVSKDAFGSLLACGITIYLGMHVVINIGMMLGFLPITGVPLILITYGGSSVVITCAALGILQSIYVRRFMF